MFLFPRKLRRRRRQRLLFSAAIALKLFFFTIENAITVKNINRHDDAVFTTHAQLAERFAADFEMLLFSCEDGVQWEELS